MQNTVRTTIRIREDLLRQSKIAAAQEGVSLQQILNELIEAGFHYLTVDNRKKAFDEITALRDSLPKKGLTAQELYELNKRELEERTERILDNFKNDK